MVLSSFFISLLDGELRLSLFSLLIVPLGVFFKLVFMSVFFDEFIVIDEEVLDDGEEDGEFVPSFTVVLFDLGGEEMDEEMGL